MAKRRRSKSFIQVDREMLKTLKGDGNAAILYDDLLFIAQGKDVFDFNMTRWGEETGMSRNKVTRCLQVLIDAELLFKMSGKTVYRKNLYSFNRPNTEQTDYDSSNLNGATVRPNTEQVLNPIRNIQPKEPNKKTTKESIEVLIYQNTLTEHTQEYTLKEYNEGLIPSHLVCIGKRFK